MEALAAGNVVCEWDPTTEDVALAARWAATTVLITADCVAAVERLARRIHAASARAASPFVLVAAASLPGDAAVLTETCADLLDTASGGSLLLTDVEDIPSTVQSRLIETLACLQAALKPKSRVRLMAGTTTVLHERLSDGTFSGELFYRLNGIHVVVKNDWAGASAAGVA